jgi:3-phosphoglycerate kinase
MKVITNNLSDRLEVVKSITDYNLSDQLLILKAICNQIYIARNISLNNEIIEEQLRRIDSLFRDKDNFN